MSQTIHVPLETPIAELFARVGILSSPNEVPPHLDLFLCQADRALWNVRQMTLHEEMSAEQAVEFQQLLVDACARVMCHPIVASNNYLRRFAQGVNEAQARHECQQFSVFALQFDVAQARLVANAPTEEAYHHRLNVLLNEKGIPYEDGFEGELSGRWREETVHFTWMRNMASGLGLAFEDVGKIWLGHPGAIAFTEATFNYYGSSDLNIASGAAFAIENWAANSLWKPWILGMQKLNATRASKVNIVSHLSRRRRGTPLAGDPRRIAGKLRRALVRRRTVPDWRRADVDRRGAGLLRIAIGPPPRLRRHLARPSLGTALVRPGDVAAPGGVVNIASGLKSLLTLSTGC